MDFWPMPTPSITSWSFVISSSQAPHVSTLPTPPPTRGMLLAGDRRQSCSGCGDGAAGRGLGIGAATSGADRGAASCGCGLLEYPPASARLANSAAASCSCCAALVSARARICSNRLWTALGSDGVNPVFSVSLHRITATRQSAPGPARARDPARTPQRPGHPLGVSWEPQWDRPDHVVPDHLARRLPASRPGGKDPARLQAKCGAFARTGGRSSKRGHAARGSSHRERVSALRDHERGGSQGRRRAASRVARCGASVLARRGPARGGTEGSS
jgi:hypothetical protein